MPEDPSILSVDLGQTNLRCALIDQAANCLRRQSVPTPFDDSLGEALIALAQEVRGPMPVTGCVVGVPGRVDYSGGCLEWGRGLPSSWKDYLRVDWLSSKLSTSVQLANDADLAAVGETYFGAGDRRKTVVYLTVSSGLGAGAVMWGRLLRARVSLLEIGLTMAEPPVAPGEARQSELLEDISSGKGLRESAHGLSSPAGLREVVVRARAGDANAQNVWDGLCRAAGMAAANLAHLLVPDIIVLGGGISQVGESFRSSVAEVVREHGPQGLPAPISVRLAALGDNSGLVGAAAWAVAMRLPEGEASGEPT
jgi:glucokinase